MMFIWWHWSAESTAQSFKTVLNTHDVESNTNAIEHLKLSDKFLFMVIRCAKFSLTKKDYQSNCDRKHTQNDQANDNNASNCYWRYLTSRLKSSWVECNLNTYMFLISRANVTKRTPIFSAGRWSAQSQAKEDTKE
jgi:hypothetical protein